MDVQERRFVINHQFEALSKHPKRDQWCFIKYRLLPRNGKWRYKGYHDTLGFIDLPKIAASPPLPDAQTSAYWKVIQLAGIAIAPPVYGKNGRRVYILEAVGDRFLCVEFNTRDFRQISQHNVHVQIRGAGLYQGGIGEAYVPKLKQLASKLEKQ